MITNIGDKVVLVEWARDIQPLPIKERVLAGEVGIVVAKEYNRSKADGWIYPRSKVRFSNEDFYIYDSDLCPAFFEAGVK